MGRDALGEFEHLVMLAILQLGTGAYGVPIREEIEARTGRDVARAAVYIALRRLEAKGFASSKLAGATAERGGRSKRYYRLEPEGLSQLRESQRALLNMREGLESLLEAK